MLRKTVVTILLLSVGAALLAGCGRRNAPVTPYEAALQERRDAQEAGKPLPPEPTQPHADRPFILDPLID